jgi:hypothetical protein
MRLKKEGLRERLVQREQAPGEPYDFGRFEIIEEPWDAPEPPALRRLPLVTST